jgi:CheY-like chemotaxis protein
LGQVLVVEDNEINLKLMLYTLRQVGTQILTARDGNEALEVISSERPDLVVLDIQLPGLSGMEVAKAVRANPVVAGTPIIAVTAYSMAGDKEKILAAGCDYYLSKPIDTRGFPRTIQSVLNGETPQMEFPPLL